MDIGECRELCYSDPTGRCKFAVFQVKRAVCGLFGAIQSADGQIAAATGFDAASINCYFLVKTKPFLDLIPDDVQSQCLVIVQIKLIVDRFCFDQPNVPVLESNTPATSSWS